MYVGLTSVECISIICIILLIFPNSQLQQPPKDSRHLREPDPTFIHNLKEHMIHYPSGPGASPFADVCKDICKLEEFQDRHKNVYKYEVLGGLHSFLVKCQLTQEFPQNLYFKVAMADVYVGLNDEQALHLAQRHNLEFPLHTQKYTSRFSMYNISQIYV